MSERSRRGAFVMAAAAVVGGIFPAWVWPAGSIGKGVGLGLFVSASLMTSGFVALAWNYEAGPRRFMILLGSGVALRLAGLLALALWAWSRRSVHMPALLISYVAGIVLLSGVEFLSLPKKSGRAAPRR